MHQCQGFGSFCFGVQTSVFCWGACSRKKTELCTTASLSRMMDLFRFLLLLWSCFWFTYARYSRMGGLCTVCLHCMCKARFGAILLLDWGGTLWESECAPCYLTVLCLFPHQLCALCSVHPFYSLDNPIHRVIHPEHGTLYKWLKHKNIHHHYYHHLFLSHLNSMSFCFTSSVHNTTGAIFYVHWKNLCKYCLWCNMCRQTMHDKNTHLFLLFVALYTKDDHES